MTARSPEEVHALLEAALNAHDADAFAAVFEPEAAMISPPRGEVVPVATRSARQSLR